MIILVPRNNVATIANNAIVIEGVSRSRNALLNGDSTNYDWDNGWEILMELIAIFKFKIYMSSIGIGCTRDTISTALFDWDNAVNGLKGLFKIFSDYCFGIVMIDAIHSI